MRFLLIHLSANCKTFTMQILSLHTLYYGHPRIRPIGTKTSKRCKLVILDYLVQKVGLEINGIVLCCCSWLDFLWSSPFFALISEWFEGLWKIFDNNISTRWNFKLIYEIQRKSRKLRRRCLEQLKMMPWGASENLVFSFRSTTRTSMRCQAQSAWTWLTKPGQHCMISQTFLRASSRNSSPTLTLQTRSMVTRLLCIFTGRKTKFKSPFLCPLSLLRCVI